MSRAKAQASRAAKSLVALGPRTKTGSESDGRGILSLTSTGKKTYRAVMKMISRRDDQVFGTLSPASRETLGELRDRATKAA